ncbi:MAG: hypothetical protein ACM3UX_00845 [Candidatus Woesearchaeota archaeon]
MSDGGSSARTARWKRNLDSRKGRAPAPVVRFAPMGERELMEKLDRYAEDPEAFIEECLWVRHIDGGKLVPFKLTVGQRILVRKVKWHLRLGKPVRIITLKSRRQRISSLCQALAYWFTSTRAYVEGLTCADKNELTEEIFERGVKTYYDHDERKRIGVRPLTESSSKRELKFGNPDKRTRDEHPGLQSVLVVTSAESKEPGRGGTKHFIHGSEASYWPEDPPPWQAMGIALSNAPGTIAIIEATANGSGGFFYETWKGALAGTNEWTPVFLPWWIDPANTVEVSSTARAEWEWVKTEEDDEEAYAAQYRLSYEQLAWRRQILASPKCYRPGQSRYDVFRQEYPACEEEAWLAAGRNFFIPGKVTAYEKDPTYGARKPLYTARVVNRGDPLDDRGPGRLTRVEPVLERDPDGELAVWAEKDDLEEYLVVADPAEGIAGRDESCIGVLARNDFKFVSIFRSTSMSTRELAHVVALLGWYYDKALVVVEANNHGGAVLQEISRILYPKLWYHRDVTKPGEMPGEKPGWVQSYALRMYALKLLEAETRDPALGIHDADFFDQARHFVWPTIPPGTKPPDNPRPGAMSGHRDDIVLMAAMALGAHVNAAVTKRKKAPPPVANPEESLRPEPMDLSMSQVTERRAKRQLRGGNLWGRGTRR